MPWDIETWCWLKEIIQLLHISLCFSKVMYFYFAMMEKSSFLCYNTCGIIKMQTTLVLLGLRLPIDLDNPRQYFRRSSVHLFINQLWFFFFFLPLPGLNSGPCACKAGSLPVAAALFCLVIFQVESCFLLGAGLRPPRLPYIPAHPQFIDWDGGVLLTFCLGWPWTPDLVLLRDWDYRHEPLCLTSEHDFVFSSFLERKYPFSYQLFFFLVIAIEFIVHI
jgi:hypothetical protein